MNAQVAKILHYCMMVNNRSAIDDRTNAQPGLGAHNGTCHNSTTHTKLCAWRNKCTRVHYVCQHKS